MVKVTRPRARARAWPAPHDATTHRPHVVRSRRGGADHDATTGDQPDPSSSRPGGSTRSVDTAPETPVTETLVTPTFLACGGLAREHTLIRRRSVVASCGVLTFHCLALQWNTVIHQRTFASFRRQLTRNVPLPSIRRSLRCPRHMKRFERHRLSTLPQRPSASAYARARPRAVEHEVDSARTSR